MEADADYLVEVAHHIVERRITKRIIDQQRCNRAPTEITSVKVAVSDFVGCGRLRLQDPGIGVAQKASDDIVDARPVVGLPQRLERFARCNNQSCASAAETSRSTGPLSGSGCRTVKGTSPVTPLCVATSMPESSFFMPTTHTRTLETIRKSGTELPRDPAEHLRCTGSPQKTTGSPQLQATREAARLSLTECSPACFDDVVGALIALPSTRVGAGHFGGRWNAQPALARAGDIRRTMERFRISVKNT